MTTSHTGVLETPFGVMRGSYQMERPDGRTFDASIAEFTLAAILLTGASDWGDGLEGLFRPALPLRLRPTSRSPAAGTRSIRCWPIRQCLPLFPE